MFSSENFWDYLDLEKILPKKVRIFQGLRAVGIGTPRLTLSMAACTNLQHLGDEWALHGISFSPPSMLLGLELVGNLNIYGAFVRH